MAYCGLSDISHDCQLLVGKVLDEDLQTIGDPNVGGGLPPMAVGQ
ncbi:hypothetical protein C4J99_2484 [Pseudomonas synxantha]|nr:hypothetical protein C4J99_2484 [Pseudomonas synxantha]